MKFRHKYSDHKPFHYGFDQTGQESKTRQSEADNCDINKIMERFNRTGKLPAMQSLPPQYCDARVVDFATAQQIINDAKQRFSSLSAEARKYFGNDPQAFLKSLQDSSENNVKKLLELGILVEVQPTEKDLLNDIAQSLKASKKDSGNSNPT